MIAGIRLYDCKPIQLAMEAEQLNLEKSYDDGKVEGEIVGIERGKLEIAKQMLLDGESMEKIIKFTKLSKEQIKAF